MPRWMRYAACWIENGTKHAPQVSHERNHARTASQNSAEDIVVAREVFGRTVDHQVDTITARAWKLTGVANVLSMSVLIFFSLQIATSCSRSGIVW